MGAIQRFLRRAGYEGETVIGSTVTVVVHTVADFSGSRVDGGIVVVAVVAGYHTTGYRSAGTETIEVAIGIEELRIVAI